MTLHIIGIGLKNEQSISIEGLEKVRSADILYLETYTSVLTDASIKDLEVFYGKEIIKADRTTVEQKAEETILKDAKEKNVCFLVVGDPFSATTHMDIWQRAKEAGIETTITHNASILNTAGEVGLELYKFGKVTSIPFKHEAVRTPYEVYQRNKKEEMHTLFLLDLDIQENKFMTCKEAITYLLAQGLEPEQTVICCAQLGGKDPKILTCPAKEVEEWSDYPQCLIIPGKLHFIEEEMIQRWI